MLDLQPVWRHFQHTLLSGMLPCLRDAYPLHVNRLRHNPIALAVYINITIAILDFARALILQMHGHPSLVDPA